MALVQGISFYVTGLAVNQAAAKTALVWSFGYPLVGGTVWLMVMGWIVPGRDRSRIDPTDAFLGLAAITVALYIIYHAPLLRLRAGTGLAKDADMLASIAGVILILEVTRRLAGLALVLIAAIFV